MPASAEVNVTVIKSEKLVLDLPSPKAAVPELPSNPNEPTALVPISATVTPPDVIFKPVPSAVSVEPFKISLCADRSPVVIFDALRLLTVTSLASIVPAVSVPKFPVMAESVDTVILKLSQNLLQFYLM